MSRLNHRITFVVPLTVIVGALAAAPAQADPVVVTSGIVNYFLFDSISVQLNGNHVSLGGQLAGPGDVPPYACGSGCGGRTLNLSVSGLFPSGSGNVLEGGGIVDGMRLTLDSIQFDITAGSILAPTTGTVSAPFSFLGTAMGTTGGVSTTLNLTGSGTATARFGPNGWDNTDYTFAGATSPTPEPASLLLLGTGIAGLIARRFRRQAPTE